MASPFDFSSFLLTPPIPGMLYNSAGGATPSGNPSNTSGGSDPAMATGDASPAVVPGAQPPPHPPGGPGGGDQQMNDFGSRPQQQPNFYSQQSTLHVHGGQSYQQYPASTADDASRATFQAPAPPQLHRTGSSNDSLQTGGSASTKKSSSTSVPSAASGGSQQDSHPDASSSSKLLSFDERDYGLDPSAFSNVSFQMPSFLAASSTPGQFGDNAPSMVDPSAINPPGSSGFPSLGFGSMPPPSNQAIMGPPQPQSQQQKSSQLQSAQQGGNVGGGSRSPNKNVYVPDVRNPIYGIYGSSVISVNPDATPFKTQLNNIPMPPTRPPEMDSRSATPDFDPTKLGLPVGSNLFPQPLPGLYSSSGFDMLGVLARVVARPNPQINIGPVDTSCSFVVVDARRYDMPIVFASATFTALTGYHNSEIIGKNCRFLQAPDGKVEPGSRRKYTDGNAVYHLRTHIQSGKESQASVINYRKDGTPFINLVTVIPITWDTDEIAYFVGFQVDLVEQPNAILEKMRDGTYVVNYSLLPVNAGQQTISIPPANIGGEADAQDDNYQMDETTTATAAPAVMHQERDQDTKPAGSGTGKLINTAAVAAAQSSMAIAPELLEVMGLADNSQEVDDEAVKKKWNKMLLDHTGDFVHVLSLKGSFLYVSPSVKNMLEYEASDLVGKTLQSFCHPSDIVPVMRELKESGSNSQPIINLLYRLKRKKSGYVWIEAQGKLYLEQSKSRKCVILVGRERPVYKLSWTELNNAGGLGEKEFWSKISPDGMFLYNTPTVKNVIGHDSERIQGTSLYEIIDKKEKPQLSKALSDAASGRPTRLRHKLRNAKGNMVDVITNFFPNSQPLIPMKAVAGVVYPSIIAQTNEYASEMRRRATNKLPVMSPATTPSLSRPGYTRAPSSVRDMIVTTPRGSGDSGSDSSDSPKEGGSGRGSSRSGSASASGGSDSSAPSTFSAIPSTFKALIQHPSAQSDNVFDELDTTRTTSWQYELHQLKLTNKKLKEELHMLQAAKRKRKKKEERELLAGMSGSASSPGAGSSSASNTSIKTCANCGRTDSPEWRVGPSGARNLCNACGLRWAKATRGANLRQNSTTPSTSTPSSGNSDVDAAGTYLHPTSGPFAPLPHRPQLQHAESSKFQKTNH